VMTEFCDSNCIFYKNKDFVLEVNDSDSMKKNLIDYLEKVEYSGINIPQLYGHNDNYKFVPGEIMVVTGDTGAGKSAFVQDMLCKIKQKSLYLNLEMHESLVYRRFLQNIYNKSKDDILDMVRQGQLFADDLSFIDMLSQSPEVTTISRLVSQKDYKFVIVDTSDGIQVDKAGNNEYVKLGMIVETFRELAQNKDIQVILIHHLKKRDDVNAPIELNDLSGNRANVTKMDHVFALEGPGTSKTLRSLKNRDQGQLNINLNFDYNVFRFNPRY
jgi:predicted ATP-dependent serine protease